MGPHQPDRQKHDPAAPSYLAPLVGFRSRKSAQLCAHFAVQEGGMIDKLKLIKLIYLTERKCLQDWHRPILFDELFSLPHGPICSSTLNGIDGAFPASDWDEYITRNGNKVVATKKFTRDDLDEVSDAEFDIVKDVWNKFRTYSASNLRNFTHDNCSEYTDVANGRIPISYKEVLEAIGSPSAEAEAIEREISELRREESALTG
jgi:uncharacterized phage-associated protein